MIRVEIVRSTVGDGGRVLGVGERLTLPDAEARLLVAHGKAVAILAAPMDAAPRAQSHDPQVARARGSR